MTPAADPEEAGRVLRERLEARGTETPEAIERRLEVARRELQRAGSYRHVVVNAGPTPAQGESATGPDAAVEEFFRLLVKEGLADD